MHQEQVIKAIAVGHNTDNAMVVVISRIKCEHLFTVRNYDDKCNCQTENLSLEHCRKIKDYPLISQKYRTENPVNAHYTYRNE